MPSITELIKTISAQAVAEGSPVSIRFGKVIQEKPLKIEVEQKLLLDEEYEHLILTHLVKDYYVDMTVSHVTETRAGGSGFPMYESHDHDYKGRKKFLIHNGLKMGEKVILLQLQGGQQYIVLDRVDDPIVKGQWI